MSRVLTTEKHKGTFGGEGNILCHDYHDGLMTVWICQNSNLQPVPIKFQHLIIQKQKSKAYF